MQDRTPFLTIFDLDETLVHAFGTYEDGDFDFRVCGYDVRVRQHAEQLIRTAAAAGHTAVWTSATRDYAESILANIWPSDTPLAFLFTRERCTVVSPPATLYSYGSAYEFHRIKDLIKARRKGYSLDRMIIIEDRPGVVPRQYGNVVPVTPFEGDRRDGELALLAKYLPSLATADSVRAVEKRHWRSRLFGADVSRDAEGPA